MVPRDERSHLATGHLNTVLGGVQIALDTRDIAIQFGDVLAACFGGQFRFYGSRQRVHLFVDRTGRVPVLLARRNQFALRKV